MDGFSAEVMEAIGLPVEASAGTSTIGAGPYRFSTPQGSYDSSSTTSKEMSLWGAPIRSADGDILPEKTISDARNRDMIRNDSFAGNAIAIHRDSIVGSNYMLNSRLDSKLIFGTEDTKWEDEAQEELESKFTLWAESPECWVDAARINTFTEMVRLAVGCFVPYGEILATAEWRRDTDLMRPFNTCIQMVDPDRLSTPRNVAMTTKDVRGGVRRDKDGAPIGYWIRDSHPSDVFLRDLGGYYDWTYTPTRLPWGRMQVLHIYEQQRPDQSRGMAEMVSALKEMRMAKKWRDISIQNAVVNGTYAASIESELPTEAIFARLGGRDMKKEAIQEALNGYIGGYFNEIGQYMGGSKQLALDGVKIPHLPPGAKLQLRPAGNGGPLGTDFEDSLIRYTSAGLGVSYEELSHNFSKTNYSGFKGAMALTQRSMAAKKKFSADRFATHTYRLFFEEGFNAGAFETLKRRGSKKLDIYQGQTFDLLTRCDWIGASSGQIDELKETQAAVLRMNAGLSTMADECAKLGKDWRALLRQLKREKEWKKFYDVLQEPVDTTNMENASQGAASDDGSKTSKDQ